MLPRGRVARARVEVHILGEFAEQIGIITNLSEHPIATVTEHSAEHLLCVAMIIDLGRCPADFASGSV